MVVDHRDDGWYGTRSVENAKKKHPKCHFSLFSDKDVFLRAFGKWGSFEQKKLFHTPK